eukprot:TRINITY_DN7956_c0_g1_i1.p1 TRINITY_DN7956_c0_g1~~TRINITY_DN7956_c0_g1_i1.p1  ORF type:complete len:298 (-),score=71.70 TRINITY_DN7956_c0_g1_i1:161-1054(-)
MSSRVLIRYAASSSSSNSDSSGADNPKEDGGFCHRSPNENGEDREVFFHLPEPSTGVRACYSIGHGCLKELQWFKDPLSSWFVGDNVIQDGSLYCLTPVDVIFLLLPLLSGRQNAGEKGGEGAVLRSMADILDSAAEEFPAFRGKVQQLMEEEAHLICNVQLMDGVKYFRLDKNRALAWLCCKVDRTVSALKCHGSPPVCSLPPQELTTYAVGLVGEYLTEPWMQQLCSHLGIEVEDVKRKRPMMTSSSSIIPATVSQEQQSTPQQAPNSNSSSRKKNKPSSSAGSMKITSFFAQPR